MKGRILYMIIGIVVFSSLAYSQCLTVDQENLLRQIATSNQVDPDLFIGIFDMLCQRDLDILNQSQVSTQNLVSSTLQSFSQNYYTKDAVDLKISNINQTILNEVEALIEKQSDLAKALKDIAYLVNVSKQKDERFNQLDRKILDLQKQIDDLSNSTLRLKQDLESQISDAQTEMLGKYDEVLKELHKPNLDITVLIAVGIVAVVFAYIYKNKNKNVVTTQSNLADLSQFFSSLNKAKNEDRVEKIEKPKEQKERKTKRKKR